MLNSDLCPYTTKRWSEHYLSGTCFSPISGNLASEKPQFLILEDICKAFGFNASPLIDLTDQQWHFFYESILSLYNPDDVWLGAKYKKYNESMIVRNRR